jgi:hypothetical protein
MVTVRQWQQLVSFVLYWRDERRREDEEMRRGHTVRRADTGSGRSGRSSERGRLGRYPSR